MGKISPQWLSPSENHELSFKPLVRLIYWMMAIDGANMGRKWSEAILIHGVFDNFVWSCVLLF